MAPGNSSRNFSAPEARNGSGERGYGGGEAGAELPGKGSRGGCPASHLSEAGSLQHRREDSSGPRPPAPPGPAASGPRRQGGEAGARPASGRGGRSRERAGRGAESIPPPQPPVLSAQVDGGGVGRAVLKGTRQWNSPPEGGCRWIFRSSPPACPIESKSRITVLPSKRH